LLNESRVSQCPNKNGSIDRHRSGGKTQPSFEVSFAKEA